MGVPRMVHPKVVRDQHVPAVRWGQWTGIGLFVGSEQAWVSVQVWGGVSG